MNNATKEVIMVMFAPLSTRVLALIVEIIAMNMLYKGPVAETEW
jgi:hypothetical protein